MDLITYVAMLLVAGLVLVFLVLIVIPVEILNWVWG